jgi:hypothetical protein
MKKKYRVYVPTTLCFDVVAESQAQARRIAAAASYTPVEPLEVRWPDGSFDTDSINISLWSIGREGLAGNNIELHEQGGELNTPIEQIEGGVRDFAELHGNENELAAALR